MAKKKRILETVEIPEFEISIKEMAEDSKLFVDKAMEIAHYIFRLMEEKGLKQKDLAEKLGKSEAEVSKWLGGMHNFTLRSIAKIETALGSQVICTPRDYRTDVKVTYSWESKPMSSKLQKQPAPGIEYGRIVYMREEQVNQNIKVG